MTVSICHGNPKQKGGGLSFYAADCLAMGYSLQRGTVLFSLEEDVFSCMRNMAQTVWNNYSTSPTPGLESQGCFWIDLIIHCYILYAEE